ncbi:MAG: hypothetical protein JXR10_03685 [Cyclobacteriaceae bacterium]
MHSKIILLLVTFCLVIGCESDEPLSASELEKKIEQLKSEINEQIQMSTGNTSDDCRTTVIPGGNGCGPIYVYGVVGIDTLALEQLFDELSQAQTELYNIEFGPVCDLYFPPKDSLINGTCKACYEADGNWDCP